MKNQNFTIEDLNLKFKNGEMFSLHTEGLRTISQNTSVTKVSAICELIDNSISANATDFKIKIEENYIEFCDNGNGFSLEDFRKNYLTVGTPNTNIEQKGNGLFGFGMKTSINFFSDNYKIISHKEGCKPFVFNSNKPELKYLEDKIPHGTTIRIYTNKLEKDKDIVNLENLLSIIFQPANINIYIGNNKIKKYDPLYRNLLKDTNEYYKYSLYTNDGEQIKAEMVYLSDDIITNNKLNPIDNKKCNHKSSMLKSTKHSGFYIKVGNRYIETGENFTSLDKTPHTSNNGVRVELEIPLSIARKYTNINKNNFSKDFFKDNKNIAIELTNHIYKCRKNNKDINKKFDKFLKELTENIKQYDKDIRNKDYEISVKYKEFTEDNENIGYVTIVESFSDKRKDKLNIVIKINPASDEIKKIGEHKLTKFNERIASFIPFLLKDKHITIAKEYIKEQMKQYN